MMIKNIYTKHFLITAITLIFFVSGFSQNFKNENRIYLLDITASMWGHNGEEIFSEVKNSLIRTINSLENPETNITVITFGKRVEDTWKAKATPSGKKELINKINTYDKDDKDKFKDVQMGTNICDALKAADKEINPKMFNYLFLYTDGAHNYPNIDLQCIKDIVQGICNKKNGIIDIYPFYIMLTDKASSSELREALGCFTIIEGCSTPEIVIIKPEKNRASINLLENKLSTEIKFVSNRSSSLPSKVKLKLTLSGNNNFKLKKTEYVLSENLGKISIDFMPRRELSTIKTDLPLKSELSLEIKISYIDNFGKCKTIEMRPENIIIDVINKKEKTVIITILNEKN